MVLRVELDSREGRGQRWSGWNRTVREAQVCNRLATVFGASFGQRFGLCEDK